MLEIGFPLLLLLFHNDSFLHFICLVDNFSLKVKTVGRTTNSVTLEISSFDRYIKSYEIFLDGNLFKDVLHISQTQNDTIQNLVPGTLYNVKVVVTADTENKDVVFDIATRK